MKIKENEIASIENIGELEDQPVEMIRTHGGLFIGLGVAKGKSQKEILAAGSHPALIKYTIEKNHRNFRPSLQKSESGIPEDVVGFTEFLPLNLRKSGHDLFMVKSPLDMKFILTKHGTEIGKVDGCYSDDSLVLINSTTNLDPAVAVSIGKIASKEALSNDKEFVTVLGKKFEAKKLA